MPERRAAPDGVARRASAAMGGDDDAVPAPDPVARDYLLLALRLDQHIPGLVDGYFGPADLKAEVDMEQLRAPARAARRCRRAARAAGAAEVADADAARLARRASSSRSRRRPRRSPASRCRTSITSSAASPSAATPPGRRRSTRGRRPSTRSSRVTGRSTSAWTRGTDGSRSRSTGCPAVIDWLVGAVPRPRRGDSSGCPTARPCGSRSSATSRGPATTGTTAGAARGSTSTPTCRSARPRSSTRVAHETYPGHHLEHAWKEADLVGRSAASRPRSC